MIVLYGATGFTGRLVTDELVRAGAEFVLAGRNEAKLRRLSEERGQGASVRAASVDDPTALRRMLEGAEVLINCAGPFTHAGEPVVRAAVDTGTHYVDSTGEQSFMALAFDRYGGPAERRGIALVPALGFDYVPGDCIARLAAEGHEPLEDLTVAYAMKGFGMSRGTVLSALEMLKGGDVTYRGGEWRPAGSSVVRASFDFPPPIGRQTMTKYPSGEILTVPRHTRTRQVTSLVTATLAAPHPALAPLVPYLTPPLSLALRTPLRGLLGRLVPRLPEGPDEAARRASEFTIVAVARGEDGSEGRGVVRGSDVYGLTAVSLVWGALEMCDPGYDRAGALGPASAYDPAAFLDHLGGHGLSWELEAAERVAA